MKKLVSKKELKSVFGIPYSFQHIWRLEQAGKFPKRLRIGPNRVAWMYEEVDEWIEGWKALRDPVPCAISA